MPLKRGTSSKTFDANVHTMMAEYQKTGMIGRARPTSPAKAREMAVAIAFDEKDKSAKAKSKARQKPKPKKRGK